MIILVVNQQQLLTHWKTHSWISLKCHKKKQLFLREIDIYIKQAVITATALSVLAQKFASKSLSSAVVKTHLVVCLALQNSGDLRPRANVEEKGVKLTAKYRKQRLPAQTVSTFANHGLHARCGYNRPTTKLNRTNTPTSSVIVPTGNLN